MKQIIPLLLTGLAFGAGGLAPGRAAVSVQSPENVVGTGQSAWSYLIVEGEEYETETNDAEGAGFTRVDASGSLNNLLGSPILGPNTTASKKGALFTQTPFGQHIDKVTYQVQFATPGTYYIYMRFTMFENSENFIYLNEDSFFLPPDFGKDPETDWPLAETNAGRTGGYTEGCCEAAGWLRIWEGGTKVDRGSRIEGEPFYWEGNFHWNELISSQFLNAETQGEPNVRFKYEVTPDMVGKPLDFTISYREGGVTIDLFLFSTSPDLMQNYSGEQLDQILLGQKIATQEPTDVVGTGANAWSYLILEGEDYVSKLNPDEGAGFTRVDATNPRTNLLGNAILAADTTASQKAALFTQTAFGQHIDKVTYKVQFATPGTYYIYMRFTMFENSENFIYLNEDSFFLPPDFGKDPETDWPLAETNAGRTGGYTEGCCEASGWLRIWEGGTKVDRGSRIEDEPFYWEGNFHWNELISSQFLNAETQGEPNVRFKYEVTPDMVGKPLDFTISYREGGVTIDLFLFSTSPDLMQNYSGEQLDQILLSGAPVNGNPPQLAISRSGTDVVISWAADASGYALEGNDVLSTQGWVPVATAAVVSDGKNTVTLPATGTKFYRLRKG